MYFFQFLKSFSIWTARVRNKNLNKSNSITLRPTGEDRKKGPMAGLL